MLRHAQMPKGSRRAPNVYRRVHSRPRHTAQWVGLFEFRSEKSECRSWIDLHSDFLLLHFFSSAFAATQLSPARLIE
jgi:hypothetical protein